jgi:hypothetical protein
VSLGQSLPYGSPTSRYWLAVAKLTLGDQVGGDTMLSGALQNRAPGDRPALKDQAYAHARRFRRAANPSIDN